MNGSDAGEIGTFVLIICLVMLEPASVNIHVEWPDGGNSVQAHDRVRVVVNAPRIMITQLFGSTTFNLTASSTMPIAH